MKLPVYTYIQEKELEEFDKWVTPSLGEIDDTERFHEETLYIRSALETLSEATNHFSDIDSCRPGNLARNLIKLSKKYTDVKELDAFFENIFSLLYMSTGKSDNNIKCQYPVFLRNQKKWTLLSNVKKSTLIEEEIPRTIPAKSLAKRLSRLCAYSKEQVNILESYIEIILSKESYISQLFYTGYSYHELEKNYHGKDLINALVTFKIKGSVTASGGHIPENILRERMQEWGMLPNFDFNTKDIPVHDLLDDKELTKEEKEIVKSRAYDFILPFKSRDNGINKLFIQCQFYAGDSGSVSHKNVDQTNATRAITLKKYPKAQFLEYVDGAGYFSALNGDLKHLLTFPSTKGFFQIRSAPIKLRRELQNINFLTLLEIEHAIFMAGNNILNVFEVLLNDYPKEEIDEAINLALRHDMLKKENDELYIAGNRREIARRYLLLDGAAVYGKALLASEVKGHVLIPGYGSYYGIKQTDLIEQLGLDTKSIKEEWDRSGLVLKDIQWLLDNGFWSIG